MINARELLHKIKRKKGFLTVCHLVPSKSALALIGEVGDVPTFMWETVETHRSDNLTDMQDGLRRDA